MKPSDILKEVNDILAGISSLKYIDRDWGQLDLDTPAVRFPCAITDIDSMQYTDCLHKVQVAECNFTVTLAVQNFHNSSQKSPCKDSSNDIYALIDTVNEALQNYGTEKLTPFRRVSLQKVQADKGFSVYQLTYSTSTVTQVVPKSQKTGKPTPTLQVRIKE